ncbi:MAG: uncharacterized protein JWM68_4147 [Verrucomicrobiales bacterium]|nr:uncharacterized protein [Verrucomicrobiales bacterium]
MSLPIYNPNPLDTSQIVLPEDLSKLTDLLAENAHEVWARERTAQGWKWGPQRDDARKEHPNLVPYRQLVEEEKRFDRDTAVETVKAIYSMGYGRRAGSIDTNFVLSNTNRKIVSELRKPKLAVPELRRLWEDRVPMVWRNVEIYRRAVDAALKLGESFLAFDIAAEGLENFKGDLRLTQLQALALARTGATRRANELLEQLRLSGHQDEETLGILARTHKDFWLISTDAKEKTHHLKMSFSLYAEAYRRNHGYYSGVNAAATALLAGQKDIAYQLAHAVAELCRSTLETLDVESEERYWLQATLAESYLIQGNLLMAERFYKNASDFGGQHWVVLNRTRSQARLLLEAVGKRPNVLDNCFKLPRIVVCSGHMFDRIGRAQPRFPHALEERVRQEIRRKLAQMEAQVGFSSLACGTDMLFAEALLERGGEVNIVLPFSKSDFKKASVDFLPDTTLAERFESILANAATVTVLNEFGEAKDGAAYEYCNQALKGLALLKGQFLGIDVMPLAIWDGRKGDGRGGTQNFVEYWEKRGSKVEIVYLQQILTEEKIVTTEVPPPPVASPELPKPEASRVHDVLEQEVKAMLFADIVGYTKLSEIQVPSFVHHFMGKLAALMDSMKNPPIVKNTWGDAIYCVFDHVSHAGLFALALREMVHSTNWAELNLPADLNIRIALHAGPVYPCFDPVLRRLTFLGSHVNRTARIEPIVEEGQVYVSQAFAALSAAEAVKEYVCDYVGTKQLAKKFGATPVFLVRRGV